MKRLYKTLLASGLISAGISAIVALPGYAEEIYKHIDEKGVPSFSDAKTKGAETIIVDPVNVQTITAPTPATSLPRTTTEADFSYNKLDIISPADQSTLRDEHKILVQAALNPGLRQGHKIEFLDNGQPLLAASRSSSIELTNFARGTHTLSARIVDKNDKVIKTSSPITLYIFRTIAKPAPAS